MKKLAALAACVAILSLSGSASAVVINEFMYTTEGGNSFIELYNRSGSPQDISGFKLWTSRPGFDIWMPVPDYTVPAGTVLPVDGFYLLVSQDLFVTVPDAEVDIALPDPQATGHVEGIRLTDGNVLGGTVADGIIDTVLYGPDNATGSAGQLTADTGALAAANEVIPTDDVDIGAVAGLSGNQINVSTVTGSGLRRYGEGASRGAEGNGNDSNQSSEDFVAYEPGSASPRSSSTPVTLSLFEIE